MWTYNYSHPSSELYHHGVKGMKWGVRSYKRTSKRLAKKLEKSFKDLKNYNDSITYKTYANPASPTGFSQIGTYNKNKKDKYGKSSRLVNKYMDNLDKKGYNWSYKTNVNFLTGTTIDEGKSFVEVVVNDERYRRSW